MHPIPTQLYRERHGSHADVTGATRRLRDRKPCATIHPEIGRGVEARLPHDLGAAFAYTPDGAERGEIVYETFCADSAVVKITGVPFRPGQARGQLVNALHLGAKIIARVPRSTMTPETAEGRMGFLHVYETTGTDAQAELKSILRDFELDRLAAPAALLRQVCEAVQGTKPRARIECTVTEQYRNLRYWLEKDMAPITLARRACERAGVDHFAVPICRGTDGSRLTEKGVPTPHIFTGMAMIHGPLERISIQDMAAVTRVCIELRQGMRLRRGYLRAKSLTCRAWVPLRRRAGVYSHPLLASNGAAV